MDMRGDGSPGMRREMRERGEREMGRGEEMADQRGCAEDRGGWSKVRLLRAERTCRKVGGCGMKMRLLVVALGCMAGVEALRADSKAPSLLLPQVSGDRAGLAMRLRGGSTSRRGEAQDGVKPSSAPSSSLRAADSASAYWVIAGVVTGLCLLSGHLAIIAGMSPPAASASHLLPRQRRWSRLPDILQPQGPGTEQAAGVGGRESSRVVDVAAEGSCCRLGC
eukprot:630853-Hanusia_phi.AAC.3